MSSSRKPPTPTTPRTKSASTRGTTPQTPAQTPGSRTTTVRGSLSSTAPSTRARTPSTQGTGLAPSKSAAGPATRSKSPRHVTVRPTSPPMEPKTPLSIRDAIALKRAEIKRAQLTSKTPKDDPSVDSIPGPMPTDNAEMSRWSISDSIQRARSTGNLNLASRSLASVPTALFQIHLGVTPDPLQLAPKESEEDLRVGKTKQHTQTSWFEAVDLTVLKLRDNAILEIQPEISLFGSLKILDLHNNQLTALPHTFADLVNLVTLDLSSNQLSSLPEDIATLPLLTTLDVSSNQLETLPLSISSASTSFTSSTSNSIFAAPIKRASRPLPSLRQLLAADNKLQASRIPVENLPPDLAKCDLCNNPLGTAGALILALSQLSKLKELLMVGSDVTDDSFASVKGFSALSLLDLGKTKVTESVGEIFRGRPISWEGDDVDGGVHIILGTRIKKEPWEIMAEKGRSRNPNATSSSKDIHPVKESWEIDAEMGMLTEGGRRRARAAATKLSSSVAAPPEPPTTTPPSSSGAPNGTPPPNLAQYYGSATSTLTLPRSLPRAHVRTRSLAPMQSDGSDPTIPTPTLPLPIIISQPFAHTLRVLVLTNRRLDPSFILPTSFSDSEPLLPVLEELLLDGCGLGDLVSVCHESPDSSRKEPIFNVLATLFPSLTYLDLSDNKLTCLSGVRALLIPDPARKTKGLKTLKLRGNKISDLIGLEAVAQVLKSEENIEAWRMEELDLRDNEIAKLPPLLGYLHLDVLLVEGNTFRVPARRVWEREGTKGLLSWLKGRVE